jgi:hypothetical protein
MGRVMRPRLEKIKSGSKNWIGFSGETDNSQFFR